MAELPEIKKLSKQMNAELAGKRIKNIILLQEKNLNISPDEFTNRCIGVTIVSVKNNGKWFVTKLNNGQNILISLGMGDDLLYFEGATKADKYQIKRIFMVALLQMIFCLATRTTEVVQNAAQLSKR